MKNYLSFERITSASRPPTPALAWFPQFLDTRKDKHLPVTDANPRLEWGWLRCIR